LQNLDGVTHKGALNTGYINSLLHYAKTYTNHSWCLRNVSSRAMWPHF